MAKKYKPERKKPGDLIRSEDWNALVDEVIFLRKYIGNMTRSVTLTHLESPSGKSQLLSSGVQEEFNYGTDVLGLITRQFYTTGEEIGEVCKYGLIDYADIIYYWAGAMNGDRKALEITLEYFDGTNYTSDSLLIHEWSKLRPKGKENPWVEYLYSPNQRLWYKYALKNPSPDKGIRFITFRDTSSETGIRIANVLQYVTRIWPLE
jgi:hypothetical protein